MKIKVFSNNGKTVKGLRIVCWDKDVGTKDDWLGQILIEANKITSCRMLEFEEKLLPGIGKKRKEVKGIIRFKLIFIPVKLENVYFQNSLMPHEIDNQAISSLIPSISF